MKATIINLIRLEKYNRNKAVEYWINGNHKKALRIFRTLNKTFSKEDKIIIIQASEIVNGHDHFYKAIGKDTDNIVAKASYIITKFIGNYV